VKLTITCPPAAKMLLKNRIRQREQVTISRRVGEEPAPHGRAPTLLTSATTHPRQRVGVGATGESGAKQGKLLLGRGCSRHRSHPLVNRVAESERCRLSSRHGLLLDLLEGATRDREFLFELTNTLPRLCQPAATIHSSTVSRYATTRVARCLGRRADADRRSVWTA